MAKIPITTPPEDAASQTTSLVVVKADEEITASLPPASDVTTTDEGQSSVQQPETLEPTTVSQPKTPDPEPETTQQPAVEPAPAALAQPAKRPSKLKWSIAALLIALITVGAFVYLQRRETAQPLLSSEDKQIIEEISTIAAVPEAETPQVTTVVDKKKVTQEFLKQAENGDKVLLYVQAGEVVVYRPSSHKIITMGPLAVPKPTVFLRNGATQVVPKGFSEKILGAGELEIISRDDAPKKNYTKTLVIDLSGTQSELAAKIAAGLGATVSTLPAGESRPDADIIVIVGLDAK